MIRYRALSPSTGDIEDVNQAIGEAFAQHRAGRLAEARAGYHDILSIHPQHFEALHLLGALEAQSGRLAEAAVTLGRAVALDPTHAEALSNLGSVLRRMGRFREALASYDQAVAAAPDNADIHFNRGNALWDLRRLNDALKAYRRAVELRQNFAEALQGLGKVYLLLRQYENAAECFNAAAALGVELDFMRGERLRAKMSIFDWTDFSAELAEITARVEQGEKASSPLAFIAACDTPTLQRRVAEIWNDSFHDVPTPAAPLARQKKKLRLGYFSTDFRRHPVAYLTADLFAAHDRSRFEVLAFSFGQSPYDAFRQRLEKSFDAFINVFENQDRDVAELARKAEIDIAIDLGGYTANARSGIFAWRAAPVQVSYLGYPGTMGAPFIDYLIADQTVIPPAMVQAYSEKIVYMPDSFQVNSDTSSKSDDAVTRKTVGLPETGFVYCAFNNAAKITPDMFSAWMRILGKVPGSVLWLSEVGPSATANLRREAIARDVAPERLVFAPRVAREDYFTRLGCADLFLDTSPYNAHTTATDVLWAGVPLLTYASQSYAGRVGASVLTALDMPELITTSLSNYEEMAVGVALNPQRAAALRQKLAHALETSRLFDTARFAGNIEKAYEQMIARARTGAPPEHITIV